MEILSGIAVAAVVWYGGLQVVNGATSPGSFFVFISSFIAAYRPIKALADLNNNLQEALSAAKRLFAILDEKPKITNLPGSAPLQKEAEGAIKIEHVKFNYLGSKQGLNDVSLLIEPGKTFAFVGKSGSGKSTILNLLLRFYELNSGDISIDGHNILDITIESLRENISYVSQDVMLFDNSIFTNIEYGLLGAKNEQVFAAAKAADAHDFIEALPNGYDTLIGQNGHKLSGGQKQRISIARALIKNAPILIFDEATSSLDNISEREIFNNLKKIRHGKTNIIVAHRLSTIIDADEIIVFKNGKIAQKGTHIDLLKDGGEYAKLYQASLESEN
jgi:subfamily B ATP-binding cassette protein MsbA